jgi:hypothetical protein
MADEYIWQGTDAEGTPSFIARAQRESHVAKRIEIRQALELAIHAIISPELIETDRNRPDEDSRYFRLLSVSADSLRRGYVLRVSVKYVRQPNTAWHKFYQSCWFERKK